MLMSKLAPRKSPDVSRKGNCSKKYAPGRSNETEKWSRVYFEQIKSNSVLVRRRLAPETPVVDREKEAIAYTMD